MLVFSGLLGMVGLTSVVFALWLLHQLSHRLGAVNKTPPFFRMYYPAGLLVAFAWLARLLETSSLGQTTAFEVSWTQSPWFALLGYHLPLTLGITISLVVTWRYWSWLLKE